MGFLSKGVTAMTLAAAMAAIPPAGCSNGAADSGKAADTAEANSPTQAAEPTEASKTKTLLHLEGNGGTGAKAFTQIIDDAVKEFNETNPYNVEIDTQWFENEQYKTRLTAKMVSNETADIFFTYEADFLRPFVEGGKV